MHCECCDAILSDFEATRKDRRTGLYLNLCQICFAESGLVGKIPTIDRRDLLTKEDIDDLDIQDNQEWD
jgi:hypothetical protein